MLLFIPFQTLDLGAECQFMFMFEGEALVTTHPTMKWHVALMVILTLWFGLMPNGLFEITQQAVLRTAMQVLAGG